MIDRLFDLADDAATSLSSNRRLAAHHAWSLLTVIALTASTLAQESRRTVRGVVHDERGNPLADVAVCPFATAQPFFSEDLARTPATTTRTDGTFAIDWEPLASTGFDAAMFVAEGRVHVVAGLAYVDMTPVILPHARTLAGTVRDPGGAPLAGVRIEARDWLSSPSSFRVGVGTWSTSPEPRTAVRSDARGRFVLRGTCDSAVALRVGGDGFTLVEHGPLAAGESFDAVAAPAPIVHMEVVDADGRPQPGLLMRAWEADGERSQGGRTDDSGRWRFTWLGDGPVRLTVRDLDYQEVATEELVAPRETVRLLAKPPQQTPRSQPAPPAGSRVVRGRVVDPHDGSPVVGAHVAAVSVQEGQASDAFVLDGMARHRADAVITGPDGHFELHLLPGSHCLVAAEPMPARSWRQPGRGRDPDPRPIEVRADEPTPAVELALQPLVACRGIVRGKLPVGAMVRFTPHRPDWASTAEEFDFSGRFPIAADGTFAADGLLARAYRAELLVPRGFRMGLPDKVPLAVVTITPDAELRLETEAALPAQVRGKVTGPVPAWRLAVLSLPANDPRTSLYACVHYAGPLCPLGRDGSFALQEAPGERTLLVLDMGSGVVLHRAAAMSVTGGDVRTQDLDVTALPLDVTWKNLPAEGAPWLDLVVPDAAWPAGLGGMVRRSRSNPSGSLGVAVPSDRRPLRLWLPPGETRLVLRRQQGMRDDGTDVLAEVVIDPAERPQVEIAPAEPSQKAPR